MRAKFDTKKVEKGFYKSAEFKNMVRIGAAAFEPRLSGGFAKFIETMQGTWAALSEQYRKRKKRLGQDPRKWVRTGRLLKALSQGRIEKQTTRKRVKYKITPRRFFASLRYRGFKPDKGKYPPREQQAKIAKNLEYGIDVKGQKRIKDRAGRLLSGRQGRRLFRWTKADVPDMEASVARELELILNEEMSE